MQNDLSRIWDLEIDTKVETKLPRQHNGRIMIHRTIDPQIKKFDPQIKRIIDPQNLSWENFGERKGHWDPCGREMGMLVMDGMLEFCASLTVL